MEVLIMATHASTDDLVSDVTGDKLKEDLRVVMTDAEALLRSTVGQAGEKASEASIAARAKLQDSLRSAKERLIAAETALAERTREAARATDQYVHENPWKSIGVAASVGVIIGMLIARR
jgi:ElaB/YqjD/DUF883 family membrane-anchored ribosome-binding protein